MKDFKDMAIEELKNYENLMDLHKENAHTISKMAEDFLTSYRNKSKKEITNDIAAFERALDLYEKESKELNFETPFVETQRGLIPVMKKLAGIN